MSPDYVIFKREHTCRQYGVDLLRHVHYAREVLRKGIYPKPSECLDVAISRNTHARTVVTIHFCFHMA